MAKLELVKSAPPQTGALTIQGIEQTASGAGGVLLGRLAMYNGTTSEEEKFKGCDFKRGNWIDVMEKRCVHPATVRVVPVLAYISWERFDEGGKPLYITHNRKDVPPADLIWPEKGQKNTDGKPGPLASECWNFVALVEGEDWPYLLKFKRTGLNAGQGIAQLEGRYATNGTGHRLYELGSVSDKNAAGQSFLRITQKPVGFCPENMLERLKLAKAGATEMLNRARQMAADEAEAEHEADDGIPI